jgi:hypothetical protein
MKSAERPICETGIFSMSDKCWFESHQGLSPCVGSRTECFGLARLARRYLPGPTLANAKEVPHQPFETLWLKRRVWPMHRQRASRERHAAGATRQKFLGDTAPTLASRTSEGWRQFQIVNATPDRRALRSRTWGTFRTTALSSLAQRIGRVERVQDHAAA